MANAALQPVIGRASTALERGQAASTIELLAPLLRTPSSLTKEDELSVRVMLAVDPDAREGKRKLETDKEFMICS